MYQQTEIKMAEKIIQLDLLRDQLYEELMQMIGTSATDLLRKIQNGR